MRAKLKEIPLWDPSLQLDTCKRIFAQSACQQPKGETTGLMPVQRTMNVGFVGRSLRSSCGRPCTKPVVQTAFDLPAFVAVLAETREERLRRTRGSAPKKQKT